MCAAGCMAALDADEFLQRKAFSQGPEQCKYQRMLTIVPPSTRCDSDCEPCSPFLSPSGRKKSSLRNLLSAFGVGPRTPGPRTPRRVSQHSSGRTSRSSA